MLGLLLLFQGAPVVAEGLVLEPVRASFEGEHHAVALPGGGLLLLPADAARPAVRLEGGDGQVVVHQDTEPQDPVRAAAVAGDQLWTLGMDGLVRRSELGADGGRVQPVDAPGGVTGLVAYPGGMVAAVAGGELLLGWRAGSFAPLVGGLPESSPVVVDETGAVFSVEDLAGAQHLVDMPPGTNVPVPVIEGQLTPADAPAQRVASLLPGAPALWARPWSGQLLLLRPGAGRLEALQPIARGAGHANGGVRAVVTADPETFHPQRGVVDALGQDLWLIGSRAGTTRVWRVRPDRAREDLGQERPLDHPVPAVREARARALVARGLEGIAELEAELLGPGRLEDSDRPRALRRGVYDGQLMTPAGRRAAVMALVQAASSREPLPRRRAGVLLGRCLDHATSDVRAAACVVWSYWEDEPSDPDRIVTLLTDGDEAVAAAAAQAIASRGYRLVMDDVFRAYRGPGGPALRASQEAALIRLRAWRPIVESLVTEPDVDLRQATWPLLTGQHDPELVATLRPIALAPDTFYRVRLEVCDVLATLYRRPGPEGAPVTWEQSERIESILRRIATEAVGDNVRAHARAALEGLGLTSDG